MNLLYHVIILGTLCLGISTALLGGWEFHLIDILKDANVKSVFQEAVYQYNQQINSNIYYVPFQVHEIHTQVVAGTQYRFRVTLVPSACRKEVASKNKNLKDCGLGEGMARQIKIQVWQRPGSTQLDNFQLLKSKDPVEPTVHDQLSTIGIPEYTDEEHAREFEVFKARYNKYYKTQEEQLRRKNIFIHNSRVIQLIQFIERGSGAYGLTEFSDLTENEFAQTHLSPVWDLSKKPHSKAIIPKITIPDSVDWRKKGAVTNVKNQGRCGSCWAFSTTGNIEGQWFLKKGKLVSLSEQQLVDCDKVDHGCEGGLPAQAYKVIMQMGGLETETQYPYDGRDDRCNFVRSDTAAYINGSVSISKNETSMAAWTAQNGPISIGINAFAMQFYFGGVSHPWAIFCNRFKLDHGVLIVGYGSTSTGEPYWIVKNSWGPNWGEQGYYLVYRGAGVCGLNSMATSATVQ